MRNGKFAKRRRGVSSKALVLTLVAMLLIGCTVGGTLAWLSDKTEAVTNTFTTSDIDITLTESKDLDLTMVPGHTIKKDPKATVLANSEECWLFVKIDKANDFDKFMTYEVAEGWSVGKGTEVEGADGIPTNVVYRKITSNEIGTPYSVLKDDQVTVKGQGVTKEMMNNLTTETYPTLTFTAYASQLYKSADEEFTAAAAWGNISNP